MVAHDRGLGPKKAGATLEGMEFPQPSHPVRFVTAASLFDGHDVSINIMRRLLQAQGAEVIHLGHNRSVEEVVAAVVDEDAQGVCISSYQGGHNEYFRYLINRLRAEDAGHVRIYGGGGGVILASEIEQLHEAGVARIFTPEDGQQLGIAGMVATMVAECDVDPSHPVPVALDEVIAGSRRALAHLITSLECGALPEPLLSDVRSFGNSRRAPVLGVTGTGGAGKSSLTDELISRFRLDQHDKLRIAVIAVDPTRRRGGGALLGDRIRMNAIDSPQIYFRSLATRAGGSEVPAVLPDAISACRVAGFDLIIVETPGIGQGDSGIVDLSDVSLYVMTPEFGAETQLEKIDMLDFADVVAINKFERRGAADALRSVRKQLARNRADFTSALESQPVFGTVASHFNDDGVTALALHLETLLTSAWTSDRCRTSRTSRFHNQHVSSNTGLIVPGDRQRYLAEIAETVRAYHAATEVDAGLARTAQQARDLGPELAGRMQSASTLEATAALDAIADDAEARMQSDSRTLLARVAPNSRQLFRR